MRISPAVQKQLTESGISQSALEKVIEASAAEGACFFDADEGCYLAGSVVGNVMLWVKYRIINEDIELLDAYYHRMSIKGIVDTGSAPKA